jgi:hypothetical protein
VLHQSRLGKQDNHATNHARCDKGSNKRQSAKA